MSKLRRFSVLVAFHAHAVLLSTLVRSFDAFPNGFYCTVALRAPPRCDELCGAWATDSVRVLSETQSGIARRFLPKSDIKNKPI